MQFQLILLGFVCFRIYGAGQLLFPCQFTVDFPFHAINGFLIVI
jgi:hypothetical protein